MPLSAVAGLIFSAAENSGAGDYPLLQHLRKLKENGTCPVKARHVLTSCLLIG